MTKKAMDREERRTRLEALGAKTLTDALLELSQRFEKADNLVDRLISTPEESLKQFKSRITGLKRSKRFIDWREAHSFANELEDLLKGLKVGVEDPEMGARAVALFFETDKTVFNRCDDSGGQIGDVYRIDACEVFVFYASRWTDKKAVCDLVLEILKDNDYGVKDDFIDFASQYLGEVEMRELCDRFWCRSEEESEDYQSRQYLFFIESLARQLGDAPLFEKTCRSKYPVLSVASHLEIAKVYFETGNAIQALEWLEKVDENESFQRSEREKLLLDVKEKLGDKKGASDIAWAIFKGSIDSDNFKRLLEVIGEKHRERVIEQAVRQIEENSRFQSGDVLFLFEIGQIDVADTYIIKRAELISGTNYSPLLSLTEVLEKENRYLAASVIFRSLLTNILESGVSKSYHHGVRYLKKLDRLESKVLDWRKISPHQEFKAILREKHGRKSSFWPKYQ